MRNINFSLFFKANLLLTSILFILFLQYNTSYTLLSFILTFMAAISSAVILYILLYFILYIFKFINKFILYLSGFIFAITNITLVIDFFIFRLYKFHINAMVINILTSPDAMDSIQLGIVPIILFVLLIFGFIGFEIYLIRKLSKLDDIWKENYNKYLNKLIVVPIITIVLSEKVGYGIASLLNKNDILTKFKVIPLYQPLTFNRIAAKLFDYKPDVQAKNTINNKANINYPLNPIQISSNPNKINIIIIASDAVRNSVVTKDITPNIHKFKENSLVFNNHHTGGNATRFGIFSMMYGLNSTYWFSFLRTAKGAVLFDVLNDLNYQIDIISSTNTNWPEFRKTAYVNVLDSIKDDFEGTPWKKDKQSAEYFLNTIDNMEKNKSFFSFVFFDAPHGYSFPKSYNKFNATNTNVNYLTMKKGTKESENIFARYKNSIYYNDMLFGKMIQKLKDKNLYDNSLIIYTSDHGQEFYEYGGFGHNNNFSRAQTNSPLIIKLPKNMKKIEINSEQLTSHSDLVPTLLSIIGVQNDISDYSNGYDLFDKNYKRDFVFCANWNNNAVITNKYTYVFSNLPNKMFENEVRETSTYKKVDNQSINSKILLDIMNENKQFLK